MLVVLDWLLFLTHTALVVFNMCGWIWKRTRVAHLITLGLTAFSWFALGAVYGWGYCVCTDYHAQVLEHLGNPAAELTFIQLMFQRLLGLSVGPALADGLGIAVFALIVFATAYVWIWPRWSARRLQCGPPDSALCTTPPRQTAQRATDRSQMAKPSERSERGRSPG